MKPQDQSIANLAAAVNAVLCTESKSTKETKVQDADKDFVDLHSIDKKQLEGSEPLTEKDIEEANEFTKAAAKAAVAGDDEFEFEGETFPAQMGLDVAKKILGESSKNELLAKDLEMLIKNPDPSRVKQYGGTKYVDMLKSKLAKLQTESIEEAIKWWTVTITKKTGKLLKGQTVDVKASNPAQAIKKGLKQMKADPMTVPSDSVDVVLGESIEEAFIDVDHADPRTPEAVQLLRKYKIKGKVLTMKGPGGMPLVRLTGKKKDLEAILKDPDGWQDNGFLAGFIEESADVEMTIEEAKAYIIEQGKKDGLSEEQIDELIGGLLKKVGNAVKSRVTKSGRADRADKKHKLAVRGKKLELKKKINDVLDKKSKAQKDLRKAARGSEGAKSIEAKIVGYGTRVKELKDKMGDIAESDIEESESQVDEAVRPNDKVLVKGKNRDGKTVSYFAFSGSYKENKAFRGAIKKLLSNSAKKKFDVYVDGNSDLVDSDSSKTIVSFNDKMTVSDVAKAVGEFISKEYGIKESNGFEPLVDEELTPYIFGDGEASVDEAVNSLDRKKAARNGANFKWEDINKALMSVGMSPPNILKVSSALRGKEQ